MQSAPLLTTIKKTCELVGCGPTKLRELIAVGELETVMSGGRRLVVHESTLAYVKRLRDAASAAPQEKHAGASFAA